MNPRSQVESATSATGGEIAPEIPLVAPLNLILSRWRLVFGVPLIAALVMGLYSVFTREFVAQSSFISEGPARPASQLIGLATQFGINLGNMGESISPDFYNWLLKSREMLVDVVTAPYSFPTLEGDTLRGTLIELYHVSGNNPAQRQGKAIRRLMSRMTVAIDRSSNVVTLRITAPWPALAERINRRFLDLVNRFNVERRQTSGAAQRDFARDRMHEAEGEVAAAADSLRLFLLRNRIVQTAPDLMLEQARLQRALNLHQQVLTTLSQSYEQARVDAVRDTPVMSIVERPEGSARPGPGFFRAAMVAGAVTLLLVLLGIAVHEYARRQRRIMQKDYDEFDRLWGSTVGRFLPRRAGGMHGDD